MQLKSIKVLSGRYTHQELKGKALIKGNIVINKIDSKGKFMWFELKDNDTNKKMYLLNTLGMSGKWRFVDNRSNRVEFVLKDKDGNTHKLYYVDTRNFGTIVITKNKKLLEKKLDQLGLDLIKSSKSLDDLTEHIMIFANQKRKSRGTKNIVHMLMNQDKKKGIGCGIGNYLCAEILYEAKISPHRDITDLSDVEVMNLAKSIRLLMKNAYVNNDSSYLEDIKGFMKKRYKYIKKGVFPDYYPDIKLNNKPFRFKVYCQKKDPLGNEIKGVNLYQTRTTWWVEKVQK